MSAHAVVPTVAPAAGPPESVRSTRRRLVAVSMGIAAAALVVGHLMNVPATLPAGSFLDQVEADRQAFLVGGLLQAASAFLLIPAAVGISSLVPARGAAWATVGTVLTGVGAAATGAGLVMITSMMAMLAGSDRGLADRVYDLAGRSSIGSLPFLLAPAMVVGLLLLGIALWRAGTVHRACIILLLVAAVLAGLAPGGGLAGALGHLPLAVALVLLAAEVWRRAR